MDRSFKNALDLWNAHTDEEGDEMDLADIERQKRIDHEDWQAETLRQKQEDTE